MHAYRSHTCAELNTSDAGQTVRLSGWVHRVRDHGGVLFVDLRDHYGVTQVLADSDSPAFAAIEKDIGRTPLPALVRQTAAALERHCIERALALAEGNRTTTAELLGLSRQSLYAKLGRYGFHADVDDDAREHG